MTAAQEALQAFKVALKDGKGKRVSQAFARLESALAPAPELPRAMGRPGIYTPEIGEEICARISGGETLRFITESPHLPHMATILRWVVKGEHKEFCEQYRIARAAWAEFHADKLLEIADAATDRDSAACAKVRIDARRWLTSKLRPAVYGDKMDVTSGGEKLGGVIAVPTAIATSTDWETAARKALGEEPGI